ncbi:hypothetical protein POM88_009617 [Heracleum sosnowskyi]|uniref:Uncharacterized protein n=1 Tax=Heracleum sosnowskyi TaxID=360622 RepID=A0AAD8N7N2_9APIA|nr:hypothetical protein POM88_009617 [Heracleum sosnowskyi]
MLCLIKADVIDHITEYDDDERFFWRELDFSIDALLLVVLFGGVDEDCRFLSSNFVREVTMKRIVRRTSKSNWWNGSEFVVRRTLRICFFGGGGEDCRFLSSNFFREATNEEELCGNIWFVLSRYVDHLSLSLDVIDYITEYDDDDERLFWRKLDVYIHKDDDDEDNS